MKKKFFIETKNFYRCDENAYMSEMVSLENSSFIPHTPIFNPYFVNLKVLLGNRWKLHITPAGPVDLFVQINTTLNEDDDYKKDFENRITLVW